MPKFIMIAVVVSIAACAPTDPRAIMECKTICSNRAAQMIRCEGATLQQADAAKTKCEQVNNCEWMTSSLFRNGDCYYCCAYDLQDHCDRSPPSCDVNIWLP